MFCTHSPTFDYDSKYDVLYYTFGDTSNSYGDEDPDNIVTLKDCNTDEVTGYTIMNFGRICKEHSKEYSLLNKLLDVKQAMQFIGISE